MNKYNFLLLLIIIVLTACSKDEKEVSLIKETSRRSYNIDGGFLFENNTSGSKSYIRKYSLSDNSYIELCQ